jgi:hypothetical protein
LRALLSREFPRIGYLGDQLLGVGADGDVRVSGNGFDVRNAAIGPRPPAAGAVEERLMGGLIQDVVVQHKRGGAWRRAR